MAPEADPRTRGASAPVAATGPKTVTGKNPTLATILSLLIVGGGQFYNGDVKKGLTMLVVALVLAGLTAGVGWLGVAIWSAIDAYRVANGTAQRW